MDASAVACADPDGGGAGGPDTLEIHNAIGFLSNTSPDPLENDKASIQCWDIIGLPAKRHLTFRWQADVLCV